MRRAEMFAFRVNSVERRAITALAVSLKRSQSDAVRFVIVDAAKKLLHTDIADTPTLSAMEAHHEGGKHVAV